MAKLAYLAYPIDQVGAERSDWHKLVVRLETMLTDPTSPVGGWFDPGAAFSIYNIDRFGSGNQSIRKINEIAHAEADIVFAFLPGGVASTGVPIEIDRAIAAGKEVHVFTNAVAFMLNTSLEHFHKWELSVDGIDNAVVFLIENATEEDNTDKHVQDYLPFKLLSDDAQMPTRAHDDDAGFDLYVVGNHTIEPGEFVDVPTDVAVELPPYSWGHLVGRSSTWRKLQLSVVPGVIDPGYRGPLFAAVHNPTKETRTVKHGTRVAQLIVLGNATRLFSPLQVSTLNSSERGNSGFGSSGQ